MYNYVIFCHAVAIEQHTLNRNHVETTNICMLIHSPQQHSTHVLVVCMHVESTCICVLIDVPENNRGYTRVSTMHVESTCICVLIKCPKKQHGVHACCSCSVLK